MGPSPFNMTRLQVVPQGQVIKQRDHPFSLRVLQPCFA
ncbi:unknown protein [Cronobacter turicensis z3032]|uniref:Uncharacterized protein n=1 Tax=Cronobacter turicensis (strain DSM 18703 / CCUG 55852 / LMG 23827 / z3032) TaxID=693216 RepID=C9Y196_CROTZ|nr:unknown protein [Cronobacter turicensis z3032]